MWLYITWVMYNIKKIIITAFGSGNIIPTNIYNNVLDTQYKYFDILGVTTSLLKKFIHNWRAFMSEMLYLHQTFTDYVSDSWTHFIVPTYQLWL